MPESSVVGVVRGEVKCCYLGMALKGPTVTILHHQAVLISSRLRMICTLQLAVHTTLQPWQIPSVSFCAGMVSPGKQHILARTMTTSITKYPTQVLNRTPSDQLARGSRPWLSEQLGVSKTMGFVERVESWIYRVYRLLQGCLVLGVKGLKKIGLTSWKSYHKDAW